MADQYRFKIHDKFRLPLFPLGKSQESQKLIGSNPWIAITSQQHFLKRDSQTRFSWMVPFHLFKHPNDRQKAISGWAFKWSGSPD